MYYVVIDTNVLVSALLSKKQNLTAPIMVIDYLFASRIVALYNDDILSEYIDVLSRKKFNFPIDKVNKLINHIEKHGIKIKAKPTEEVFLDKDDIVFLR